MGAIDVAGKVPVMTSGAGVKYRVSQEGPGLNSTANSSGYSLIAPGPFKTWTKLTLYWRGYITGTPPTFSGFVGITYDSVAGSPYWLAFIGMDGSGNLELGWNNGSFNSIVMGAIANGPLSVGATVIQGGALNGYLAGKALSGVGWPGSFSGSYSSSSTSTLSINSEIGEAGRYPNGTCTLAAIWNRALSKYEMARLHPGSIWVLGASNRQAHF